MEDSPKWFEGARLNIAENLLKFRDDRIALIAAGHVLINVYFYRIDECISSW